MKRTLAVAFLLVLVLFTSPALLARRPAYLWADRVAIGDNMEQVNEAVRRVNYPPLWCVPNYDEGGMNCHTGTPGNMLTVNFDKDNRLALLDEFNDDPDRTKYLVFKTALTLMLGAPKVDRRHGTRLILVWHQSDGSSVTLEWIKGLDGSSVTLGGKAVPED